MSFVVYILASRRNGTLYVGVTRDLPHRLAQHRVGAVPGFTQAHGVTLLVHVEVFETVLEARAREAALKRWRRAWKIALIEQDNPEWADLAEHLI